MAIIKCKMCGGDIQLAEDKTFGTCEYCGSVMTLPKISDDQRAAAFNRGNHFRRMGEFDKALAVYERIVAEDDNDAEAHWCCALCRFGIEYVEDPATYEWLPTCHRASFDSFLEDVDYLAAVEHSDGITRRQYQKDAAKIAEVQRGILATSQNTEPYDVFISYKELDAEGNRTRDSILAQDIYYQLTEKGWRVFFSRISLEDVPGTQYEPYIFAALNSAKVMIVVGTSADNLNAVWVKNEWSRYLSLMRKDRSKLLLPCYRDMDPYDLPEQLSVLMSYDMGKIGFIQDLIRGVDKVLNAEKPKEAAPTPASAPVQERVIVQQTGGGPNVTALLKRGQQALEDGDWDKARGFYDQVLSMDAENAEAFLGLALAGSRSRDTQAYLNDLSSITPSKETRTLNLDMAHRKTVIEKSVVPGYCDESELSKFYDFKVNYPSVKNSQQSLVQEARARFDSDRNLNRAFRYASGESKQRLDALKKELNDRLNAQIKAALLSDQKALEQAKAELVAKTEAADRRAEELSRAAQEKREADYQTACRQADTAREDAAFTEASAAFRKVGKYKDAQERAMDCEQKAEESKARREQAEREAKERAIAARKKKMQKLGIILGAVAVAAVAVLLLVTQVIIPERHYDEAEALLAAGEKRQAAIAFARLDGYRDADERRLLLWNEITERDVISAGIYHTVGLYADGTVVAVGKNSNGQCKVGGWTDLIAVSARYHTVGLRADGTAVAAGNNSDGRCEVGGWTDLIAVSAGAYHTVGLRADGTAVAVGDNSNGRCEVGGWTDLIAVSAGMNHTVGLRADGTVVAVGKNNYGQCEVSGWTNIVAVSTGLDYTVGLREDGTVVAVGRNTDGQCEVGGWTDIVAISAGMKHTVGLCADGMVVAVGDNSDGQCEVGGWTEIKIPEK